jgi:hypothetical protein
MFAQGAFIVAVPHETNSPKTELRNPALKGP